MLIKASCCNKRYAGAADVLNNHKARLYGRLQLYAVKQAHCVEHVAFGNCRRGLYGAAAVRCPSYPYCRGYYTKWVLKFISPICLAALARMAGNRETVVLVNFQVAALWADYAYKFCQVASSSQ